MTRTLRLLVTTVALAGAAGAASAQQISNPNPPRTDLNPRPAGAPSSAQVVTPMLSQREQQIASPIAPHVVGPTVSSALVGPVGSSAAVGVRAPKTEPAKAPEPPRRAETKQNVAMMIVGGAALIVGAIIDKPAGTIIMVGGAGVGLYGLYKYLE